MLCLYSGFVACLEEISKAFVSEADNHVTNIDCHPVGGKSIFVSSGLLR
jgi:hypothetical protein